MHLNDRLIRTPTFYSKAMMEDTGPQPCRVVYIHSERRFYVVEFTSSVTGERWRESLFFPDREGNGTAVLTGPRLPR